jgi:hypothetical protein
MVLLEYMARLHISSWEMIDAEVKILRRLGADVDAWT